MNGLNEIIKSINEGNTPNLNPTKIYEEGWMIRLLVYYSIINKIAINTTTNNNIDYTIDFAKKINWCSEAVISSPFAKAPKKKEHNTHADMALGDFKVEFENDAKIILDKEPKFFGILEAKIKSNLSKNVKNADDYNQASRTLACIANLTHEHEECEIFFGLVAPREKIKTLKEQISNKTIKRQVESRFNPYKNTFKEEQNMDRILEKIGKAKIFSYSFEEWLKLLEGKIDNKESDELISFYGKTLCWNKYKTAYEDFAKEFPKISYSTNKYYKSIWQK
ncbi:hypothetical protein ACFL0J_05030 [Candidatus Neomarinimicrobiota bacterium]